MFSMIILHKSNSLEGSGGNASWDGLETACSDCANPDWIANRPDFRRFSVEKNPDADHCNRV